VSTINEIKAIAAAKKEGLPIFAEVSPHHLFLTIADYAKGGCYLKVNPPLRTECDRIALWKALNDGTIDAIGSDHAPHTSQEKELPYYEVPSGVPNIETTLPLLLDAYHHGMITLETITRVTRYNIEAFFHLPENDDLVLVDLNLSQKVTAAKLKSKCGWTPFEGRELKGWPVYTLLKNRLYHVI
jgi:dihydroorotase